MKYNKPDPNKRNQYIKHQKASFISARPINLHGSQQLYEDLKYDTHKNLFMHHPTRISEQRISEQRRDGEYLSIFEDQDLLDPFPKLENCKSTEQFRKSVRNKQIGRGTEKKYPQAKQSLQSTDSLKFPLKSISEKNINSPDQKNEGQGEFLVIRAKTGEEDKKKQENSAVKNLKEEIRKHEDDIKKIKEENLQLRLKKMKLASNSDIIMMIELKAEQRTLLRRIREMYGLKQDSEYDNQSSVNENNKNARVASRLQSQSSIYTRSPPTSMKPGLSELEGIKKTNTPKLSKIAQGINRFSSQNMTKVQSSHLLSGGKY